MTPTPTSPAKSASEGARVALVVAVARDGAIGRGGDMLFHLRDDLRHFKALTDGHALVMGRKTFESLPGGALPGRRNIVVTRNPQWHAPGAERADNPRSAIATAAGTGKTVFVIGGGQIYAKTLSYADTLVVTHIDADAAGADTWFVPIDPAQWQKTFETAPACDSRTGIPFTIAVYRRKSQPDTCIL